MTQTQLMDISMPGLLIGMSGYAQSGKDTIGKILADEHGFRRLAFANALRAVALGADPIVGLEWVLPGDPGIGFEWKHLSELVDQLGWEKAKTNPNVRDFLQKLGTEGCRRNLGDDVWLKPIERAVREQPQCHTVLTDVRFKNEAQLIKKLGGVVWRVTRPGVSSVNGHASERDLDNWVFDHHFINDSTIEELARHVTEALDAR